MGGKPLELEQWQYEIIATLLARDANGRRLFTEGLLGLPRKNGKSTLSSAIALFFLIFEGTLHDAGAEVYAAAASKDQAKIVFSEAKRMVLSSPHSEGRMSGLPRRDRREGHGRDLPRPLGGRSSSARP
jgi:phage terminase large subunit-like protein